MMSSDRIDEAAAAWFARLLAPDCAESEREAFEQWCASNPSHADAFAAVAEVHATAALLRDDERMLTAARGARHTRHAHGRRRWAARFAGLAAAAVLALAVVAGGALWIRHGGSETSLRYVTAVGELREVRLADGTRLQLDTATEIAVHYGDAARELTLMQGRLRIDVAEDARPFSLRSGRGIVRDIGTRFQVARYGGDVAVTLFSGAVSVALAGTESETRTLAPGEELRFGEHGSLGQPARVDLDAASGWTQGTLAFRDRSLGDLLDEMNRYSDTKIRIADPALSSLRVSGVFRAGDQTSLLQALRTGWSIRSQRVSDNEITLSSAH